MKGRITPAVAVFIVVVIGAILWGVAKKNPRHSALATREIATRVLARHLDQQFSPSRVLVVSNPFTQKSGLSREIYEFEEAGVRGLQTGLRKGVGFTVVFPELRLEAQKDPRSVFIDAGTTTPLSYLVAEDAFDKLAAQHSECELIVSLIGLPANIGQVEAWQRSGPPRFALLLPDLRVLGNRAAVMRALKSGKLAAFVLPKPGGVAESVRPLLDMATEFEKRYLLVTAENVDQLLRTYPRLF
jgi:hypothetical protein